MKPHFGEDICSLCGKSLDRPTIGLSWFIGNLPEEIFQYGETTMHMDCFDGWKHRLRFSHEAYPLSLKRYKVSRGQSGYLLHEAENYALVCGPIGPHTSNTTPLVADLFRTWHGSHAGELAPFYTDVILRDWDFRLRSNWYDWEQFIFDGYKQQYDGLSTESKAQIDDIMTQLRGHIPGLETLWAILDQKRTELEDD